ncbi:MAG: Flp family type IVb pilin [Alphaproteobacteria bacterium]
MRSVVRRAISAEHGATAVEYGMIAAIVAVVLAALLPDFFVGVDGLYTPVINFFAQF